MIIAITVFKPKKLFKKCHLLSHEVHLFQLARENQGNINAERLTRQGYCHTLTAWE